MEKEAEATATVREREDDDALSLSDLPLLHHTSGYDDDDTQAHDAQSSAQTKPQNSAHFDFEFGLVSRDSQMCTADELFFQGWILPFRHSFSFDNKPLARPIPRCHSLDRSILSNRNANNYAVRPPPRTRNQFLSHSSPSPRIRESIRWNYHRQPQKPSPWNIFRMGLVTPQPELTFQDLKLRSRNGNFGSRKSTISRGSSVGSGKTKKIRAAFLPGCRYCSIDAVDTLSSTSRVMIFRHEYDGKEMEPPAISKTAATKKQLTRQRTFEWIKQLP